jgi:hypothetical protein
MVYGSAQDGYATPGEEGQQAPHTLNAPRQDLLRLREDYEFNTGIPMEIPVGMQVPETIEEKLLRLHYESVSAMREELLSLNDISEDILDFEVEDEDDMPHSPHEVPEIIMNDEHYALMPNQPELNNSVEPDEGPPEGEKEGESGEH